MDEPMCEDKSNNVHESVHLLSPLHPFITHRCSVTYLQQLGGFSGEFFLHYYVITLHKGDYLRFSGRKCGQKSANHPRCSPDVCPRPHIPPRSKHSFVFFKFGYLKSPSLPTEMDSLMDNLAFCVDFRCAYLKSPPPLSKL